jgi:AraC family L-rhamnose operon transcriptional activator RhaR/AraC family L-rhamnose operon regulatory protein RhaS
MFRTLKSAEWFPTDGFPIAIEARHPQEPFPPHKHEFSEIVIVTGGRGIHVVGRESWHLAAGDVFVICGPRIHEYGELEKLNLINIIYQPEKLKLDPADLTQLPGYHALLALDTGWRKRNQFKNRLRLPPKTLGRLLGLVSQLEEELKQRAPGFAFVASALFMQILAFLCRCYNSQLATDGDRRPRIAEVISHMEAHLNQAATLDELAALAKMSKRNLIRAFHEATGLSPMSYWNQLRLTRAAALLRTCSDPITEISFRVGFADSNYFTRQFRKLTGQSPRDFRRSG